ncbi:hypothetical protein VTI28DRAFT_5756 [Corynascus sepedonium]
MEPRPDGLLRSRAPTRLTQTERTPSLVHDRPPTPLPPASTVGTRPAFEFGHSARVNLGGDPAMIGLVLRRHYVLYFAYAFRSRWRDVGSEFRLWTEPRYYDESKIRGLGGVSAFTVVGAAFLENNRGSYLI